MYRDIISQFEGQRVTVFLNSSFDKSVALTGKLVKVGEDYVVVEGKEQNQFNYVPIHAVTNIVNLYSPQ